MNEKSSSTKKIKNVPSEHLRLEHWKGHSGMWTTHQPDTIIISKIKEDPEWIRTSNLAFQKQQHNL